MQLKKYTDYALRVLIYCASQEKGKLSSISDISETFNISEHHLRKIVFNLTKMELLESIRGRNGGIQLAKPPSEMNVGILVRQLENEFTLLECFDKDTNHCIISPACKLKHTLGKAMHAFFKVLEEYTIEDLVVNREELRAMMGIQLQH